MKCEGHVAQHAQDNVEMHTKC